MAHLGGGGHPGGWRVHRESCQKWPLSYNSGMAWPIVTKFGVPRHRDQAAMHITQVMGGVHLHVCTCPRADVHVSQKRLDGLR